MHRSPSLSDDATSLLPATYGCATHVTSNHVACGTTANDVVTATLLRSLQVMTLSILHEHLPELRFSAIFPPPSITIGNILVDGFRRACRFFISLRSISVGCFTVPIITEHQRGFNIALLPVEEFRSISGAINKTELEDRRSFWQSKDLLFLIITERGELLHAVPSLLDRETWNRTPEKGSGFENRVDSRTGLWSTEGELEERDELLKEGSSLPPEKMSPAGHMSKTASLKNSNKSEASENEERRTSSEDTSFSARSHSESASSSSSCTSCSCSSNNS